MAFSATLRDLATKETYLLVSFLRTEFYAHCGMLLPCHIYTAHQFPKMIPCEIKLRIVAHNELGQFLFQGEAATLQKIRHDHVVDLMGFGNAEVFFTTSKSHPALAEFIALEPLKDWNTMLNFIPIQDSVIRQIFKRILETVLFIHSKSISLQNLSFENIKCNDQGIIKITGFSSGLTTVAAPLSPHLPSPCHAVRALGIILAKMRFGPYVGGLVEMAGARGECENKLLWNHLESISRIHIGSPLKGFIKALLCKDPAKCLSLHQVPIHSWMMDEDSESEQDECLTQEDLQ